MRNTVPNAQEHVPGWRGWGRPRLALVFGVETGNKQRGARMRLFICGPVEWQPEFNRPAFMAAEQQLRALGYDTANPARLMDANGWEYGEPQADLHMLADCDGVALLSDWQTDRRARMQKEVAERISLTVQHIDTWPQRGQALPPVQDKPQARQMVGMANQGRGLWQEQAQEVSLAA